MAERGIAWAAVVFAVSLVGVAGVIWAVDSIAGSTVEWPFYWEDAAAGLVFPLIGALILHHRPRNRLGWVILVMGLAGSVAIAGEQYAFHGAVAEPGSLPAPELADWVSTWVWFPIYGLVPLVLLLFPEAPPDGWWAPLVPATIVVTLLVVVAFGVTTARDPLHFALDPEANPFGGWSVLLAVDRRFDRARYNARRTIEEFGQQLRDEVEIGRLVDELERVATSAVHRSSAGVWFPRARSRG